MGLTTVLKMGLYEDSRGQSLADGDFVLCFNPNESEFKFYEGRIVSSQGLLMVRLLENALDLQLKSDIYVLKMDAKSTFINLRHEIDRLLNIVDKFTIDTTWIPSVKSRLLSIKTFEDVAKSWMFILYGAYANIYQAECMYHSLNISEDILSDYYLSIMSIRGTYIRDVCGNKINLGDLVVTYNKSNRNYCYGVVISETEILTENHRKRKESEVYKILNLTAEEKQMQQALLKSSLKSEKGKGKQVMKIGQVYETAYDYYIYLGKCRLDVGYAGESNVVLKSNYVEFPEEVYLKIHRSYSYIAKYGISSANYRLALMEALAHCLRVEKQRNYVDNHSFAVYYTLETINTDYFVLAPQVPRNAKIGYQSKLSNGFTIKIENPARFGIPEYLENLSFTFIFCQ